MNVVSFFILQPIDKMSSIENTCLYTYKPCPNPRSVKKNGKLHCFCDFHRRKANATQKAHAAKKRNRVNAHILPTRRISDQIAMPQEMHLSNFFEPCFLPSVADDSLFGEWILDNISLNGVDEDLECLYTYKPCKNLRSKKKNGTLHSFCQYHRTKANAIQKAHAKKKRMEENAFNPNEIARPFYTPVVPLGPPLAPKIIPTPLLSPKFDVQDISFLHEWLVQTNTLDEIDYQDDLDLVFEDYNMLCDLFP
ncbi:hypothetical protein THRCLA_21918 [Thraustotheca clavata]|uniref:Uncharacterized protein n=1 Tax=Thraustotheca clavata TaxID=74557 RepID=A0A1V9ZIL8_9STRA|nr:hypothetical protein THRCLA_21918 [Thraustotheca clavata]